MFCVKGGGSGWGHCQHTLIPLPIEPEVWQTVSQHIPKTTWDVINWKHFPRYWPFVRIFTGLRWIPHTKASDAELWCFLWTKRLSEQSRGWWFETPARSYDVIVMFQLSQRCDKHSNSIARKEHRTLKHTTTHAGQWRQFVGLWICQRLAFDCIPHGLIIGKQHGYGVTATTRELV